MDPLGDVFEPEPLDYTAIGPPTGGQQLLLVIGQRPEEDGEHFDIRFWSLDADGRPDRPRRKGIRLNMVEALDLAHVLLKEIHGGK